jgi:dihydrolipoamide dehydrogenase
VLGVHIMGPHASDLIAEAALAMRLGATAHDIAETIHAHPTVPEAMMEAAMAQLDGAIHFQRR